MSLLAVFVLAPAAIAQPTNETSPLVLTGSTLIDGTGATPRQNVTLVIEDGNISSITDGTASEPPQGSTVIDLSGHFILPGLIDSHVHIAGHLDPQGELRSLFDAGVTTVRDMGGDARTLTVLARDAKLGAVRSPDVYYSALMFGPPFLQDPRSRRSALGVEPGTAPWSRVVTPDSDLSQLIAEAKGTGATGLKLYSR